LFFQRKPKIDSIPVLFVLSGGFYAMREAVGCAEKIA